jgi:hypothetical protein
MIAKTLANPLSQASQPPFITQIQIPKLANPSQPLSESKSITLSLDIDVENTFVHLIRSVHSTRLSARNHPHNSPTLGRTIHGPTIQGPHI